MRLGEGTCIDYDMFQTTNQTFHESMQPHDHSAVKKYFKKKTPFTQFNNAYFSGGVFFNPPVGGL